MINQSLGGHETLPSVCVYNTMRPAVGRGMPSRHMASWCDGHFRRSIPLQRAPNCCTLRYAGDSMNRCVYCFHSTAARLAAHHRDPGADILSRSCLETINIQHHHLPGWLFGDDIGGHESKLPSAVFCPEQSGFH